MDVHDFLLSVEAVPVDDGDALPFADGAGEDLADGDAADVIGPFLVGDEHLEWGVGFDLRRGDVGDDGLEDGLEGGRLFGEVDGGPAFAGGGVNDGEIECDVVCAEADEQVEDFVDDVVGAAVGAVDLVNNDDGSELVFEGLAEDEAGLGHGAVECVDEEQDAVGHLEDAFDFAAEVGVAGRVDDVDLVLAAGFVDVPDSAVFAEDGDSAFAFEGV